ncbi:glycosyltransferase [Magnetospira thiophila]
MPQVSVILPCYNARDTVAETIRSVYAQDHKNIELILVDDGSTDGTGEVLRELVADHPQTRIITTENRGVYSARNTALAACNGDFIAFIDADDVWFPDKISRQLACLAEAPAAGMCHTAATKIDGNGIPFGTLEIQEAYQGNCFLTLLRQNGIILSSAMIRRAVLEKVHGFDDSFRSVADWEFWIRVSQDFAFAALAAPLLNYRYHPGNMSRNIPQIALNHARIIAKSRYAFGGQGPEIDKALREAEYRMNLIYGRAHVVRGDRRLGRRMLFCALCQGPLTVFLLKSFLRGIIPRALDRMLHRSHGLHSHEDAAPT